MVHIIQQFKSEKLRFRGRGSVEMNTVNNEVVWPLKVSGVGNAAKLSKGRHPSESDSDQIPRDKQANELGRQTRKWQRDDREGFTPTRRTRRQSNNHPSPKTGRDGCGTMFKLRTISRPVREVMAWHWGRGREHPGQITVLFTQVTAYLNPE